MIASSEMIGRFFQWLRLPGLVQPFAYVDAATGQQIKIRTSPRYTVLSVGSKEFFFCRETGAFDGTGAMSLGDAPAINYCRADRIRRSKRSLAADGQSRQP